MDPLAGDGTVLAVVATETDAAVGGTIIGEWQAGATMANGTADTLAGHRLSFLSGSREANMTSEGAGIFDLTGTGTQMFLNAVAYMMSATPPAEIVLTIEIAEGQVTVTWTGGGELQTSPDLVDWAGTGNTSGSHTEALGAGNLFFQVFAP